MIFVDEGRKHRYIDSVERKLDRKKFRNKIKNFDSQIKNARGAEPQNFRQVKQLLPEKQLILLKRLKGGRAPNSK